MEFFFAAGTKRPYNHLAINPENKTYAMTYYNEAMATYEIAWASEANIQNRVGADGWTVLAAFPLTQLLPRSELKAGTEFRANFFRSTPWKIGASPGALFLN